MTDRLPVLLSLTRYNCELYFCYTLHGNSFSYYLASWRIASHLHQNEVIEANDTTGMQLKIDVRKAKVANKGMLRVSFMYSSKIISIPPLN